MNIAWYNLKAISHVYPEQWESILSTFVHFVRNCLSDLMYTVIRGDFVPLLVFLIEYLENGGSLMIFFGSKICGQIWQTNLSKKFPKLKKSGFCGLGFVRRSKSPGVGVTSTTKHLFQQERGMSSQIFILCW